MASNFRIDPSSLRCGPSTISLRETVPLPEQSSGRI